MRMEINDVKDQHAIWHDKSGSRQKMKQPWTYNQRPSTERKQLCNILAEEAADRPAQSNGGTGLATWAPQGGRNQPDTGEH
jgi:hypothetical protein